MRTPRILFIVMGCLALGPAAPAQSLPLEIRQGATHYNLQSTNGVPIAPELEGSNGQAPPPSEGPVGTLGQFQNLIVFGGGAAPTQPGNLDTALNLGLNAERIGLPIGKTNGVNALALTTVRVGVPFLSRSVSFLFGDTIPVPDSDEYGVLLSVVNTNLVPPRAVQSPEDYWQAEPHSAPGIVNPGYYWSVHAQRVFAINPGQLQITWRKTVPSVPEGTPVNVGTTDIGGTFYTLYTNLYVISGSAVKTPRKMYWTEESFATTGKPITVPSARIGAVHIAYNNNFPKYVSQEAAVPGPSTLLVTNTLWYDQQGLSGGQIRAYNREGRVFMEILGDAQDNPEVREHLGFEIVDVIRQPNPADITVELGEKLTAYPSGIPDDSDLFPEPLLLLGETFSFQFNESGSSKPTYYAIRETINLNDLQMHWLEEGLEGLRWPLRFVRYKLVWPDDISRYSHYIRPRVDTEAEAKETAVALPSENAPVIDYQDPLDQPRGHLTESFAYYSWLTPNFPVHRALLRFSSGGNIRFERVLSLLDENLKSPESLLSANVPMDPAGWDVWGGAPPLIRNLAGLAEKLTAAADPLSQFIKSRLSASTLTALTDYNNNRDTGAAALLAGLETDLNIILNEEIESAIPPSGVTWTPRESDRNWTSVASSSDGTKLVAAAMGGQLFTSTDSGVSWTPQDSNRNWFSVASSADGSKLIAVEINGKIYTSSDSGATWTEREETRNWRSVASSADGTKLVAVAFSDLIYTSADSGVTWTPRESNRGWISVASSADGAKLVAVANNQGKVYTSSDSGVTWTARETNRNWWAVASSADGTKLVAAASSQQLYTSSDSGVTWTPRESNRQWRSVASSADGTKLAAVTDQGRIYISSDTGVTWTERENDRQWRSVASSADGRKLVAAVWQGRIYTSTVTVPEGPDLYLHNRSFVSDAYPNDVFPDQSAGGLNNLKFPRVINQPVFVGQRITAPDGETGGGHDTNYLAGYILQSRGVSFNPLAYNDPFLAGFEAANRGAIIPVNAIPGNDQLEVWWFRKNQVALAQGFKPVFWPSVIGRYTLQWPQTSGEIVLASNDGSGPLPSLEAKGSIYIQNKASLPGYNPNEEHALMQGGQAFALRDDLNITTNTNGEYSSHPFVLLHYTEADGRPAMRPFNVLREKPAEGITFNYAIEAGTVLQPPMPLPLMEKPLAPRVDGEPPNTLNTEVGFWTIATSENNSSADLTYWQLTTTDRHFVQPYRALALQEDTQPSPSPQWFYPTNVSATTLEGWVSDHRPFTLEREGDDSTQWTLADTSALAVDDRAFLHDPENGTDWIVNVTNITSGALGLEFLQKFELFQIINLLPVPPPSGLSSRVILVRLNSGGVSGDFASWRLAYEPLPPAITDPALQEFYASFTLEDRKGNTWIYRGPHEANVAPSMVMQFYYKTLPGFYFPSLALGDQPDAGTVTPYLRARNSDGTFDDTDDPVYGNVINPQTSDGNALGITYRPVWPESVPVLQMAETLLTPKRGLPDVRRQTSLEIIYQQSQILGDTDHRAVTLHDPTREKTFELGEPDGSDLDKIPAAVKTQIFQGKTFFPNLPPHLAERFFLDPNRGDYGALVFKGEFVDASLGDKYVHLNVVGTQDRDSLIALAAGDEDESKWITAIDNLTTTMELFIENPAQPGSYIPSSPEDVGHDTLAEVKDDDVAVDSYALTATGPGVGYVSLIAGNGRAFTPEGEPVSVKIIKVVDRLYRGEVNIVESSNPLNEKLTLQQVIDLAGKTEDYDFEWLIASPVDGLPPVVYQNTPVTLLSDGTWSHLRYPLESDTAATAPSASADRLSQDVTSSVAPLSQVPYNSVVLDDNKFLFDVNPPHRMTAGNAVVMRKADGTQVLGTVHPLTTANELVVSVDPGQPVTLTANEIHQLNERVVAGRPQSIVFREFSEPPGTLSTFWLSLDLNPALGANVYIDGQRILAANTGQDDAIPGTPPGSLNPLDRAYRLNPSDLAGGTVELDGSKTHTLAVELFSTAIPGSFIAFNARLEAFQSIDVTDQQWLPLDATRHEDGVRAVLGGNADVRSLADNYVIMRYRANKAEHASYDSGGQGWSQWTTPQLAEGWIKRVLKGINPFNQRVTDLFNNSVNTGVSILAQAGQRWEGDVALNLDTINNAGLIEIYETVLKRGKSLSIGGGINFGPANDALLLAAGYINDLYMIVGNEAWADASNPTIGIGTKDNTYGDIATALFSFRGQLPTLLEEELALLRGRDDFLLPGVELRPVYNRMIWNYTRGIDAGEVVYALNYNILDQNEDGAVDADDARMLYPQGHGDAYGHYLTALKGYYSLLLDPNFDWVPRIEAVTVLGKPVSVDYQDERKFASAAAALARAGRHIFDLTWRRDHQSGTGRGWSHFASTKNNTTTRNVPTTRYWGLDHWASRTGQGSYLNWIVGNAILPDVDPDPAHQGSIQQVDRMSVPELKELATLGSSLQTAMDNAEAGHTPLGLPASTIPFDLNPVTVLGGEGDTHFEQIYQRAKSALNNAVVAFDDAKDVTRLMRSEEDSLADFRTAVNKQELAYTNTLIELYGTPYPDDIGPGKTYRTGYTGPDLFHSMYVDTPETETSLLNPRDPLTNRIDTQTFDFDAENGWVNEEGISDYNFITKARENGIDGDLDPDYEDNDDLSIEYTLAPHGFFQKPREWTSRRASPGKIQRAISDIIKARNAAYLALYNVDAEKGDLDWALWQYELAIQSHEKIRDWQTAILIEKNILEAAQIAFEIADKGLEETSKFISGTSKIGKDALPTSTIAGLSNGGDLSSIPSSILTAAGITAEKSVDKARVALFSAVKALEYANSLAEQVIEFESIAPEEWNQERREATSELRDKIYGVQNILPTLNQRLQELDDAKRNYRSLLASGDRIQAERQIFRQRAAAVIQGFRTRDAAFRIFRNEKLERYKSLFDLASQYAFMAAQAYDYETGLLHTDQGREFINRIIQSRALGVIQDGEPQFAGSNTGDPGLSSAMAEMFGDWSVLKGRLGFNNPDAYGTTVSLRTENLRILPGTNSNASWKDVLNQSRMANLLDDADVRRYCMQLDSGTGLPIPGIVLEFSTTIADGLNLFGRPLAAGDHAFTTTAFTTKIFAAGVALEGYLGMDDPAANSGAVEGSGAASPDDPSLAFLDEEMMSATPYIYLIPVGVDSMRSPPLGDASEVRTWSVDDVAIPLPFNIGGSEFSDAQLYQSSDSLSEQPFAIRKHQAFRPVSSASLFDPSIYTGAGALQRSQYTSNRLIGRSAWNSRWKLIIPGRTLLNNPDEGLERFIKSVTDVKLHFVTYSYSGN